MSTVLVTGGGRGIGLELVRQLVQLPESQISLILVTTRGPSQSLDELISSSAGRIIQVQCEITDDNSVKQAAAVIEAKLAGKGLDILINNVGVCSWPLTSLLSVLTNRQDNAIHGRRSWCLGWTTVADCFRRQRRKHAPHYRSIDSAAAEG